MNNSLSLLLEYVLPQGILKWFDVIDSLVKDGVLTIVLTEKNEPPLRDGVQGKTIHSKGFKDISVRDFPIRGKKTILIFRRRYWQVDGEKELLKRDIPLCAKGTQLEKEFADFLKDASQDKRRFFGMDC